MNKKFINTIDINDYDVLTDTGFESIEKLHTTINYKVWFLKTENRQIRCADNHIVFDKNYNEIFVKDLKINNTIIVGDKSEKVLEVYETEDSEEMFDLELNVNGNKRYYTNGILSHNTSTAWAIATHFNLPVLYINASDETSVDIIRTRITNFCSTADILEGKSRLKIVILDEIDGVSDQFFKALRGTMDKFKSHSRFIATTNYINKLPEAVQSRFEAFNFDFDKEESQRLEIKYMKRVAQICKEEGIGIEKEALVEFVRKRFPDFRSILNTLNGYIHEGVDKITMDNIKKFHGIYKDLFELVFKNVDPVENYKFLVSEYSNRVDDVLSVLGNEFIEYIEMEHKEAVRYIPQIIIEVALHQAQRVHVIDPVITMLSLVYKVQTIINGA